MRQGGQSSPAPDSSDRWSLSFAMENPTLQEATWEKCEKPAATLKPLQPEQSSEVSPLGPFLASFLRIQSYPGLFGAHIHHFF